MKVVICIDNVKFCSGRNKGCIESRRSSADKSEISISTAGLRSDSVELMRQKHGSNVLTRRKPKSFMAHFVSNLNDPIIKILLGALLLNIIFSFSHSNWPETIGVAAAVLIATTVSTVSEYSSCRAAEKLAGGDDGLCFVRRDNKAVQTSINDIVVGDVVLLSPGMMIPADGVLVSGAVSCNQSALTGEGRDVKKRAAASLHRAYGYMGTDKVMDAGDGELVFRGSTVTGGKGEFLVVRVGDDTLYGEVAAGLQEDSPDSPLKHKLSVLAGEISFIGYIAAAMVAVSYLFNVFVIDSGMDMSIALAKMRDMPYLFHELLSAVTLAVSILVVAVPEGLPMMITVVLSSNMKRMLWHGVLVKRMVGIETAGGMSILFTDKTGTLTEGKMALREIVAADGSYTSSASLSSRRELYGALYAASAMIPGEGETNPIDRAAKEFFGITGQIPPVTGRIPFSSEKRFAAAAVGGVTYVRGAPEVILRFAEKYLSDDGAVREMTDGIRQTVTSKWKAAAGKGIRVIASAYVDGNALGDMTAGRFGRLVFCGLLCFEDRLRHDAARSVKMAREAGIRVVMMTGDNVTTASAIAEECGILRHGERVLTGEEISRMSDGEIKSILPELSVIARALPSDKLRVVRLAREAGFIAGMTGDGINDAPALKAADVGFAMGSGTDVTKEAGDIVITDNSFTSIIRAALYGRTIFRSIRKFVVFQLTMNLCATAVSFIGPFVRIESPVTVIQMLWVNIIMDTLGALAFAGEPTREEYMKKPPFPSGEKILTGGMIAGILLTAAYMIGLSMYFLLSPGMKDRFAGMGDTYFLTAFFAFFIFLGIGLSFNSRTPKLFFLSGIGKNKPFILIMTAVAFIQLLLVYFGGDVFRCVPLMPGDLGRCALIASTVIPAGGIIKILLKNRERDL